jgi:hypothetical protein
MMPEQTLQYKPKDTDTKKDLERLVGLEARLLLRLFGPGNE